MSVGAQQQAGQTESESQKASEITVQRWFSAAGVHPYDEVSWQRRDIEQTNWRTGETIFTQSAVEFPDF